MHIKRNNTKTLTVTRFNNEGTAAQADGEAKDMGYTKRPKIVRLTGAKGLKVERREYSR